MNIDLQISIEALQRSLTRTVSAELHRRGLCVPGVLDLPLDGFSAPPVPAVIDRVVVEEVTVWTSRPGGTRTLDVEPTPLTISTPRPVGDDTLDDTVTVNPVVATVALRLPTARLTDLVAAGESPTAEDDHTNLVVEVGLVAAITTAGAEARLSFGFSSMFVGLDPAVLVDASLPGLGIPEDVLTAVANAANALPSIPLSAEPIAELLPGAQLWNAGVVSDGTTLTLRLQFDRPTTSTAGLSLIFNAAESLRARGFVADWRRFYASGVPDRRATLDWGIFLAAEIFTSMVDRQIAEGLAGLGEITLDPDEPPVTTWRVDGTRGVVHTDLGLIAVDACVPWGTDIDVDLSVDAAIGLARVDVLRADVAVDYGADRGELLLCAVGNALLAGAVLGIVGGVAGGGIGAIIGGAIGVVVGFVGTLVVGLTYAPPSDTSFGALQPVEGAEDRYFQEFPFALGDVGGLGRLWVTRAVPSTAGLLLGGELDAPALRPPELAITSVTPFSWGRLEQCTGETGARATVHLINRGTVALRVCHVALIDPTPSPYRGSGAQLLRPRPTTAVSARGPGEDVISWLEAPLVERPRRGSSEPNEVRVLLQTTGGSRVITIAGVGPELTDELREESDLLNERLCAFRRVREQPRPQVRTRRRSWCSTGRSTRRSPRFRCPPPPGGSPSLSTPRARWSQSATVVRSGWCAPGARSPRLRQHWTRRPASRGRCSSAGCWAGAPRGSGRVRADKERSRS